MIRHIFLKRSPQDRPDRRAQGMVEFAIALPILVLLLFGVMEFARLFQAWLSVQNGARFGVRFAVTGEYNPAYCGLADAALGYGTADAADGQIDCRVPASFGGNFEDMTNELIDWARVPSIRDVANQGAAAIQKDSNAAVGQPRFFKVTICSSRDDNLDGVGDFGFTPSDQSNFIPASCSPTDDAGAPGDRVTVVVDFNHPLILPFISSIWPEAHLVSKRDGVVERFRTSRVINLPMDINLPTYTPTDTLTPLPPTETSTPEPPTAVPSATPPPDCSLFVCSGFSIGSNAEVDTAIVNNSALDANATRFDFNWDYAEAYAALLNNNNLRVDWFAWNGGIAWGSTSDDFDSNTDTAVDNPGDFSGPVPLGANSGASFKADLDGDWGSAAFQADMLGTDFGLAVYLDNGCVVNCAALPRPLPAPNCALYSISDFSFSNYGNVEANVTNGDLFNANLTRVVFDWGYAEQLMASLGKPDLKTDWMSFLNTYVWGSGDGGAVDTDSPTNTGSDSQHTFNSVAFPRLSSSVFRVDLDYSNELADWLTRYGLVSSDFGVRLELDNGCVIDRPAVLRPIATPTPNCSLIYPEQVQINGDRFEIRVRNNNVAPAFLTRSVLVWPTSWGMYFNFHQFNGITYYNQTSTTSPIDVILGSPIRMDGINSALWLADFNNWPANVTTGYFSGDLTFNFPGWGPCQVFGDLLVTPTSTATATAPPTATRQVTATATRTASPTIQIKPTETPTLTPTRTPTETSPAFSPTPSSQPLPTTPVPSPTRTGTPTVTRTPTPTITFNFDG